jgi:hypothetical protein
VRLRAWFLDVIRLFPPLNGDFAEEELPEDEATAADYSIGTQMIYIAFAWSKAELAYQTTLDLAAKHDLAVSTSALKMKRYGFRLKGGSF